LYVYDEAGNTVGESTGYGSYECVRITQPGKYTVEAYAYLGASVYNLRIGRPGSAVGCENATDEAAPAAVQRLIALPTKRSSALAAPGDRQARPQAAAWVQLAGLRMDAQPSGVPTLIHLPDTQAARASGLQALRDSLGLPRPAPSNASARAPSVRKQLVAYGKLLRRSGQFAYVAPDRLVRTTGLVQPFPPDDPWYPEQRWHYEQINLPSAMGRLQALANPPTLRPIVAVIDSGIVSDHPDFIGQTVPGRTFFSTALTNGDLNSANPDDPTTADTPAELSTNFHGTHVAGTIAARTWDGTGAAGVAPMALLMPLRVFNPSRAQTSAYDVVNAMLYAAGLDNNSGLKPARRADVINMSLGSNSTCPDYYQATIQAVRQAGVVVVAAASNDARNDLGRAVAVGSPANCQGSVSVGALNVYRQQTFYSNSGPRLSLAAPGGDSTTSSTGTGEPDLIVSTIGVFSSSGKRVPSIGAMAGTSMASPHVAGVIALMKYVYPGLTPEMVDNWIAAGQLTDDVGSSGRDNATGMGLINARKAVDVALQAAGGGAGGGTAPKGEVMASPHALDFGSHIESLTFSLLTTAATDEVVQAVSVSSPMLAVSPQATNTATGLGTYQVRVDRSGLPSGASAFPEITVRTSLRTIKLSVTVVKGASSTANSRLPDYGQIYVVALDADTGKLIDLDLSTRGVAMRQGEYRWSFQTTEGRNMLLLAGADLDQNGYICDSGEPCGAFPLLSDQLSRVTVGANTGPLNFALAPMGTGGVEVKSVGTGGASVRRVGPVAVRRMLPAPQP
ncbi:MAG: hypothetical protein RI907_2581, partial [Pseudomonadota bacterium]